MWQFPTAGSTLSSFPAPLSGHNLRPDLHKFEIVPKLFHSAIELTNILISSSKHDPALHRRKDKGRQRLKVRALRKSILGFDEKGFHHRAPRIEQRIEFLPGLSGAIA